MNPQQRAAARREAAKEEHPVASRQGNATNVEQVASSPATGGKKEGLRALVGLAVGFAVNFLNAEFGVALDAEAQACLIGFIMIAIQIGTQIVAKSQRQSTSATGFIGRAL